MSTNRYCGVVVPTITPFTSSGAIDEPAIGRIAEVLIGGRNAGIFPLGTTGESMSIHSDDKRKVVTATVKAVNGRAMVYAGIASNCFRESVELADAFAGEGVEAVVAHPPCYYPLTDADMEAYFLKLADRVKLPLVLYNIPVTTHMNIALDVVERLKKHPNIVAIKDSSGDGQRIKDLLTKCGGRGGFPVLLGNSSQFSIGLKAGGVGLIPSGSHLIPHLYQSMYESAMASQWDEVEKLQKQTDEIVSVYVKSGTLGAGLAKLKALLEAKGICGRTMLPPIRDFVGNA